MFYTKNHSRWCIFTEVMVNEKQYTYNIQRVLEISTLILTSDRSRQEQRYCISVFFLPIN
jgi:hypothetical protein